MNHLVDNSGGVLIAYEHLSSSYVAYSPDPTRTAFTQIKVNPPSGAGNGTSLATGGIRDSHGNSYFVWTDVTGNQKSDSFLWLSRSSDNFATYDLLTDQVVLLPGLFADTLATAPIERLAILRIDGDLYASTRDALVALYDRVSPGGFVIVDDYGSLEACRRAVDEFVAERDPDVEICAVDWTRVCWRKQ